MKYKRWITIALEVVSWLWKHRPKRKKKDDREGKT